MEIETIKLWVNSDKIILWLRTNIPWRLKSLTASTSCQPRHSFSVFIVEQFLHLHQTLLSQSFLKVRFSRRLWRKRFSTRLISCVIILATLVCFRCFNSFLVSYDFHCLMLRKQTSNIIIIKILTAIMQYLFIHKKL